jgi:hypothetical protein
MPTVRKIVLDVLKPHLPNLLEFAASVAAVGKEYRVSAEVVEMDEKTETLTLTVEGDALDFANIQAAISGLGGSVHSIDACVVLGDSAT